MSSFLQCSIELLNSYYFVEQKKCKRGLLKSEVLTHVWTIHFPPNFASNLPPPPLSQQTRFNQRKGPTAPGGAQSPSSPPAVAPTALPTAWLSGAGSARRSPASSSPSPSVTGRNRQHRPGWNKKPRTSLASPLSLRWERLVCSRQRAQTASWTSPGGEVGDRASLSPFKTTSRLTRVRNIHHLHFLL